MIDDRYYKYLKASCTPLVPEGVADELTDTH
jgi:hypothetical protein